MKMMPFRFQAVLASLVTAVSSVAIFDSDPRVKLDAGTVIGTTIGGANAFLGIPFAEPPVGDLRFRLPKIHPPYKGTINASTFGLACVQQVTNFDLPSDISPIAALILENEDESPPPTDSEDCLTINVFAPASATPRSRLPVLFWIYGGAFEAGASSSFAGNVLVEQSLAVGEPVVYVSINYRLAALGFPGGKEVREAGIGNLGLHDQRLGLQWVHKYISAFGGDPSKVTIWGESAGAISVALQMLTNGGNPEGLFRAAFMQSGSPIAVGPLENGQQNFDTFATAAGCGHALGSARVFDCLRSVPLENIRNATNLTPSSSSYESLALAWLPREDGVFLTEPPQQLVARGSVAPVPFVTGDCDDEGTIFALTNSNITTDAELTSYLAQFYVKGSGSGPTIAKLLELYPADPAQGSPFDTGSANAITPQYKRIASILGDLVFQAPRRFFLAKRAGKQRHWAYLAKFQKSTEFIGAFHSSDISNVYGGGAMGAFLIHFATFLDPSGARTNGTIPWPAYTLEAPTLMTFAEEGQTPPLTLSEDTYRQEPMEALIQASLTHLL